ncbi:MAG TPA: sugar phosphate isomerase/epimerase [Candidatus Binataceae bacterium]|jgi:sugar phosphate isomerase/epimerase|nr:sugar phosphate isomerase/epimerase [Candidatus Binataceae bacterium]
MRRVLGPNDLIASHYSISGADVMKPARHSFAQRVAAAAAAGFGGIGWTPEDYDACRAAGVSEAEMRAILNDHGVRVAELEFVSDWAHGGERATAARQTEDRMYRMADLLGPRHMNVGELRPPAGMEPLEAAAERFAALCDRAAAHGLQVAIEFLPWTGIPDPKTAWEICRLAGRRNGGLLVDSWHYFHSGADATTLRSVPRDQIIAIQFDDASRISTDADMLHDTLHRSAPGEGVFDLVGFIRLLDEIGVQAPISVEIISPEQQQRPIAEAARIAHDTSAAVIARART